MRPLLLPLTLIPLTTLIAIFFIACGDNQEDNSNGNSSITINKIEKTITKKQTNLGCGDKEHNSSQECREEDENSAQFILNTLAKDLDSNNKDNITTIKKNLTLSLKEITKEESKQDKLRNSLVALVNKVNSSKGGKGKDLQNFVRNINDSEFENEDEKKLGTPHTNKIASIRDELTNLVELEDDLEIKPKEVKKRLESLIANVTESKNNLFKTQKTLTKLVKEAEEKDTPSAKKFANAIIKDVSDKKISIIEENDKFFIIRVKSGDNLSILAQRYYNNRNKYKLIYEANRDKINSKYEIYPGSKLLIPKI
jgi:hypothetical protein